MATELTHASAAAAAHPPAELRHRATEIAAGGLPALRREARQQTRAYITAAGPPGEGEAGRFADDLVRALTNLNSDSLISLCADAPTLFTATPACAETLRHPSAFTLVMANLRAELYEAAAEEIAHP